jgi:hypothetical protein
MNGTRNHSYQMPPRNKWVLTALGDHVTHVDPLTAHFHGTDVRSLFSYLTVLQHTFEVFISGLGKAQALRTYAALRAYTHPKHNARHMRPLWV